MIKAIFEVLFMLSYVFLCLFCANTYLTRVKKLELKIHDLTEQIKLIKSSVFIGDDGK